MARLPSYINIKKDRLIHAILQAPFVAVLNYLLFGKRYITEVHIFAAATLVTLLAMSVSWQCHIWVAGILRIRFYKDREIIKRLVITNIIFLIITGIMLAVLFWIYEYFRFLNYELDENTYNLALVCGTTLNVLVSVVQEGVYSFENLAENRFN